MFILRLPSIAIIIIIVPTIALITNLIRRYIKYSIAYIKWEKKPNLHIHILNESNLLFIFVEGASI